MKQNLKKKKSNMKTVNGYRNFSFGDIIKFTDNDIDKKFKNKEFRFIKVDGEDYMFYDVKQNDIITIRAYYFNIFIKTKEEQQTITTYEFSYIKK